VEVRVDLARVDLRVWRRIRYRIVFGLAPALQGPKAELRDALHEVVGRASAGRRLRDCSACWLSRKLRSRAFLLIGAALLIQTFWRLQHESPGFDTRDVLTAQ